MCFVTDDYDWTVGHQEESSEPATRPLRCGECGCAIAIGQLAHRIYMQEADEGSECLACLNGDCSCLWNDEKEESDCCQCENPSVGETFEYHQCDECHKFLAAIKAAELAAGCREYESQPYLGQMICDVQNGGEREAKKYFQTALRQFPELKASGYLGRLWKRMFVV